MAVYFIIYTLCFLTMFGDRPNNSLRTKKRLLGFSIIVLTLFFGLRWKCGTDWTQYYEIFRYAKWDNFLNMNRYGSDGQNVELGFAFINVFLKSLGLGSYTFYLLITNLLRFILMAYVSIKLSKTPIISFFGFLSLQYLFPTRNPYATAVYFVAFVFILNRSFWKYVAVWLGAVSIHVSSIIVFPLYYLYGLRLKFVWQMIVYGLTIVMATVFSKALQSVGSAIAVGYATIDEKIATYTQIFRETESSRGVISMALPVFFLALFEWIRTVNERHMTEKELKNFDFLVICYIIATGLWNLLMNSMPDLCRYVEFINTWPLLIPYVIVRYKKYFPLIVTLLILYYLYRMNNTINLGLYRSALVPYRWIFD